MARPTTPQISRSGAARAALEVIDEVGLDGFKLTHVAEKLNVRVPSLYHHFENREDLVHEALRSIFTEVTFPARPDVSDAEAWLLKMSIDLRRSLLEHPNMIPLLATTPLRRLLAAEYDRSSRILVDMGVPLEVHILLFQNIDSLVVGSVVFTSDRALTSEEVEDYPSLGQAVESNPYEAEDLFIQGVTHVVRGVLVNAGAPPDRR